MGLTKEELKPDESIVNKYALLIGVDHFTNRNFPDLPGVLKDIENFSKLLSNSQFSTFEVTSLSNPTLVDARKSISEICRKASENDVIFFYYSGHGTTDDKKSFFLLFADSESDYLDATCLESEYILSQFRKSKCKNFIIIIDACHSGAFFNNNRGLPNGLVALTACDEDQMTVETLDGGMFSNIIIKGLKSDYIDANRDGKITFSELFEYITDQVRMSARDYNTPKKWEWNVDRDIYLFNSPRPVFISYQRKQKDLVKKISASLKQRDIGTFVDQEKIRIGDNWKELLKQTIKNSRAFLLIMDHDLLHSEVANWELETAHQNKVPILPIMIEDIKVHAMFEQVYGHYNRMMFDPNDFDTSMDTIIDHILAMRIKPSIAEEVVNSVR